MKNTRINRAWTKPLIIDNDILYLPHHNITEVTELNARFEFQYGDSISTACDFWVHKIHMKDAEIKQFRKWCKAKGVYIKSEQGNLD